MVCCPTLSFGRVMLISPLIVVDVADGVDICKTYAGKRVTLLSDSYRLERILPSFSKGLKVYNLTRLTSH